MDPIAYRSKSVRESLVELKDTSELAVDLGYAAALYDLPELAEEVLALEARAESLRYPATIALMLAARRARDAERLVGIVRIVEAATTIANAAADVAGLVTNGVGLPEEVRAAMPAAEEALVKATVREGAAGAGATLAELSFETAAGVSVIAVRRGESWTIDPDGETELTPGDVVIGSGSDEGLGVVREALTGTADGTATADRGRDRAGLVRAAELLVELKDVSELAVGLGYAAVLFDDDALAREVQELERRSDRLRETVETLVIEAGNTVAEPARLRGLLHIATASEAICDAAGSVAEIVLRDGTVHPVFAQAIGESDERIATATVAAGSRLDGTTLGAVDLEDETGVSVMAVRRGEEWLLPPSGETGLEAGDVLVGRGPERGIETLTRWLGKS